MNRLIRKAITLALAGVITLGMATSALASSTDTTRDDDVTNDNNTTPGSHFTKSGSTIAQDTATINLIKDYQLGDTKYTGASNTSTFNFKITPYGVWNAGSSTGVASGTAYTKSNMPTFRTNTYSINATAGSTDIEKTSITLPEYKSVGDFWYLVQETVGNVITATDTNAEGLRNTGVVYGTNDAITHSEDNKAQDNYKHTGQYYLHVQVVNNNNYKEQPTGNDSNDNRSEDEKKKFYRSVTLHKTAPSVTNTEVSAITNKQYKEWTTSNYSNPDSSTVKVNAIENKYYAGSLSVTKAVEGNAADKDKRFEVTVVFTKPANTIINSAITYSAVTEKTGTSASSQTIAGQTANSNNWKKGNGSSTANDTEALTNTVKFYIKSGETVTFNNIPYGVTYTVTESDPNGNSGADNSYQNKISIDSCDTSATWSGSIFTTDDVKDKNTNSEFVSSKDTYSGEFAKYAEGSITDASDTVTITNKKDVSVDIGVVLDNAPYIAMLVIIAAAAVIFFVRRKPTIEE